MADESPQWNEMACPKDFNSVETDKISAPLRFCRCDPWIKGTSPKVRAGHVPFGADDRLLPLR
jgi:hypothetical protein